MKLLCTAFAGNRRIGWGELREVARAAKTYLRSHPDAQILIFDDITSEPIELDLRGRMAEVLGRLPPEPAPDEAREEVAGDEGRGPGRPKLGVVAREVTLLPRHWEWLAAQPGGASVALRKLVEQARVANRGRDRLRRAQESAYRFLSAVAGNQPGFEEAVRALFAGDAERFGENSAGWPKDVRNHARKLASAAFAERGAA